MIVNLVCRIGIKPEKKVAKNGTEYYTFTAAINEYVKKENKTIWLNCVCFNSGFAPILDTANKGAIVEIIGDLQVLPYLDKTNSEVKISYNMMVHFIKFSYFGGNKHSSKEDENEKDNAKENEVPQTVSSVSSAKSSDTSNAIDNDDLPF